MKIIRNTSVIYIISGLILAINCYAADVMVVKNEKHEGSFQGYKDGTFSFKTSKGKVIKVDRKQVTRLELKKPVSVSTTLKGKNKSQSMMLKKYGTMKFTFVENKKDKALLYHNILEISTGGSGGGSMGGGAVAAQGSSSLADKLYSVSSLLARDDLSEEQSRVAQEYDTAKNNWKDFVEESSRMQKEMEQSKGQRREELLNKLRYRKNEEQPVKNALINATKALLETFPQYKEQ
jgi:hypothetical protein